MKRHDYKNKVRAGDLKRKDLSGPQYYNLIKKLILRSGGYVGLD
jgi:hypothetical protein